MRYWLWLLFYIFNVKLSLKDNSDWLTATRLLLELSLMHQQAYIQHTSSRCNGEECIHLGLVFPHCGPEVISTITDAESFDCGLTADCSGGKKAMRYFGFLWNSSDKVYWWDILDNFRDAQMSDEWLIKIMEMNIHHWLPQNLYFPAVQTESSLIWIKKWLEAGALHVQLVRSRMTWLV